VPLGQAREAVKALLEVPEVARPISILERKERVLRILRRASAAFEEGRIPPTLYSQMVRKYMAVLVEVSRELEGVDSATVEKAVEKALALALSDKRWVGLVVHLPLYEHPIADLRGGRQDDDVVQRLS